MIGSYAELENRYRDIIMENKVIRSELADLRKIQKVNNTGKVVLQDSLNMPLRKTDCIDRYDRQSSTPGGYKALNNQTTEEASTLN